MRSTYLFILICFALQVATAQKKSLQTFEAKNIAEVFIKSNEVFHIDIRTEKTDLITIQTHSEGVYAEKIEMQSSIENHILLLSSAFQKILASGYDKLSATKSFAINVKISLPPGKKVVVLSNLASVKAKGRFASFEAELESGRCDLINFSGSAIINTIEGGIFISSTGANLQLNSRKGKVKSPTDFPSGELIKAKTINGDIEVKKIE